MASSGVAVCAPVDVQRDRQAVALVPDLAERRDGREAVGVGEGLVGGEDLLLVGFAQERLRLFPGDSLTALMNSTLPRCSVRLARRGG